MVSDVAVSFHCVSSSSRLFPSDTAAENTAVCDVCVRAQNPASRSQIGVFTQTE